jgi:hypothetical protein
MLRTEGERSPAHVERPERRISSTFTSINAGI